MIRRIFYALGVLMVIGVGCRSTPEIEEADATYPSAVVDTTRAAEDRLAALFAGYDSEIVTPAQVDTAEADAWVDSVLTQMTLAEKIGQMIIVDLSGGGIRGLFSDPTNLVQELGVGGFLVPRLMSPRDVRRRTQSLQQASKVPLFFAADYERGVGRFNNALTEMPSNMAIGATRDDVYAAAMGRLTAIESRAIGVNLVFAPVVDVNNNPANPIINIRSYGEDPELVGSLAAAYVREAQRYGLQTTLKHFPGHGDTEVDTHARMAVIEHDRATLDSVELRPYAIILSGDSKPAAVMSAHLWARALDDDATPATFSARALGGVLREELGFDGFIVTDDVKMGALQGRYSFEERILSPLRAGADVILTPSDPARAVQVIRNAVADAELSESSIDASVRRILRAKARGGLHRRVSDDAALEYLLEAPRGALLAQAIADEAVTLLRSSEVLRTGESMRRTLVQMTNYEGSESIAAAMELLERRQETLGPLSAHRFDRDIGSADISRVLQDAGQADVIVVSLYLRLIAGRGNASLPPGQTQLVRELVESEVPVILVTFGNPYAISAFPEADGHVVAYDQSLETIRAVHRVLVGEIQPAGRLPITVDPYPFGAGLDTL